MPTSSPLISKDKKKDPDRGRKQILAGHSSISSADKKKDPDRGRKQCPNHKVYVPVWFKIKRKTPIGDGNFSNLFVFSNHVNR